MGVHYEKATKRYVVRLYRDGKYRVRERLPAGTTRKQAEAYFSKVSREAFEVDRLGIKPDRTIDEAIAKWIKEESWKLKSQYGTLKHLETMLPALSGKLISDIPGSVENYIKSMSGTLAPSTINRRLLILKRICTLAFTQWEWLDQPIAHKIRLLPVNNARQIYLTKEEILKIVRCCERRETRALVLVAAWTGLRLGEIITSSANARKWIYVKDSKNGKPRVVPLVGYAKWAIKDFPLKLHPRTLTRDWEAARAKAGFPHVHFHDLRHSFASMLLAKGVTMGVIGGILGHKSQQTTKRYAHLSVEAATEALRKIA